MTFPMKHSNNLKNGMGLLFLKLALLCLALNCEQIAKQFYLTQGDSSG